MRFPLLLVVIGVTGVCFALPACGQQAESSDLPVTIELAAKKVVVRAGAEPFAEYLAAGYARPVLYPLLGPQQRSMVRHWPLRDDAPGEAHDHPHHKSLWFAHGLVNGLDFWSEKAAIENVRIGSAPELEGAWPGLQAVNRWLGPDGPLLEEVTTLRFAANPRWRSVDCKYELTALTDVLFGDTKEGTFALRTNPALNLTQAEGGPPPGHAENSNGERDADIWGKRAEWVAYFGRDGDTEFGLAVLDHPTNFRHPTTWHAREYGLVAANPFGLHDFLQQPAGSGNLQLPQGKTLTLRYRLVFFLGPFDRTQVAGWFAEFAK